jgi:hypothetical protein
MDWKFQSIFIIYEDFCGVKRLARARFLGNIVKMRSPQPPLPSK